MIDTHCHLNDELLLSKLDEVIKNFEEAGVNKAVCASWNLSSSLKAKEIALNYDSVYYSVGFHPDNCLEFDEEKLEEILKNKDKKLVAIGEIGLDYFIRNKQENEPLPANKDKETQKEVFRKQILLAIKYNLPIIIHCRDAYGDTLEILKEFYPLKVGVVMHCYGGSKEYAQELIKLGVKMSFTGSVTFKNAKNLQEVIKSLPIGSFFFETDCPYLTPEPNRGKINEPKNVVDILNFVADLRGEDVRILENITDETAQNFFNF